MQDLNLSDYARIDGYVQLQSKPKVEKEKPEELDEYQPPTVDELAPRLRMSDNSSMVPPWEAPEPPADIDDEPSWVKHLIDDPDFEDMGPYTNSKLASQYHSGDVEVIDDGFDGIALSIQSLWTSVCFPTFQVDIIPNIRCYSHDLLLLYAM